MEPGFRVIEHPADIGLEARGRNFPEVFSNLGHGLMHLILDAASVRPSEQRIITLTAEDREQLVVRWLTELLYLFDGQRFIAGGILVKEISPTTLKATLEGEILDPGRHLTRLDIKAVTYHQLEIKEDGTGVVIRVFLDI